MAEKEEREVTLRAFSAYGLPLKILTSFRYLRRVITVADDDWPEVVRNMEKARAVWRRTTSILSREGADRRVYIFFFKAVVQSIKIFGTETWVATPCMGRVLGGFQD